MNQKKKLWVIILSVFAIVFVAVVIILLITHILNARSAYEEFKEKYSISAIAE